MRVILVPFVHRIEPACEKGLATLEARGYAVWRVPGFSAIDQGRSQMATEALAKGFEELIWIDADIAFDPEDVVRLGESGRPLVCGIYMKKASRSLACHVLPGTKELTFGREGGLVEVLYAGMGFVYSRRQVYEEIRTKLGLPVCNARFGKPIVPYFLPMVAPDPATTGEEAAGHWYLGEDYAFFHRARQAGYPLFAETTIRLGHIGSYAYTWEDAGSEARRFANYTFRLEDADPS